MAPLDASIILVADGHPYKAFDHQVLIFWSRMPRPPIHDSLPEQIRRPDYHHRSSAQYIPLAYS
ncbi:hypothetical protein ASE85_08295 [Sphingobium sp. Leaf26]|nr:hypothetical protein ASE85_08295 [Sphingobium sp. Leaf26]